MQFLMCNHDGKLMSGNTDQLLPLLKVLQELQHKFDAEVLFIAPNRKQTTSCFSDLLPASPQYFNSLISDLRTTKTLAGPIVLFFDQILSKQTEEIFHLFKFNCVYVTPDIIYNFVKMCQKFELNSFQKINGTFVFDFYEPSNFQEYRQLPPKKRYSWIKQCQIKFQSKTNTNQDSEIIVWLIMNKETSLSSPEPEDTSEQKSKYEGTFKQNIEALHNTRSSFGGNKESSEDEEKTEVKVEEAEEAEKVSKSKKRPRSESSGETPAKKRRCKSKRDDDDDYKPYSTRPRSSTGQRSWYKRYTEADLDFAVLEVLEGTLTPLDAAEKHNVPSRTLYDRLKRLRDNEEDCWVSSYVWEIYQLVGFTRTVKRCKSQKRQQKLAAPAC